MRRYTSVILYHRRVIGCMENRVSFRWDSYTELYSTPVGRPGRFIQHFSSRPTEPEGITTIRAQVHILKLTLCPTRDGRGWRTMITRHKNQYHPGRGIDRPGRVTCCGYTKRKWLYSLLYMYDSTRSPLPSFHFIEKFLSHCDTPTLLYFATWREHKVFITFPQVKYFFPDLSLILFFLIFPVEFNLWFFFRLTSISFLLVLYLYFSI